MICKFFQFRMSPICDDNTRETSMCVGCLVNEVNEFAILMQKISPVDNKCNIAIEVMVIIGGSDWCEPNYLKKE